VSLADARPEDAQKAIEVAIRAQPNNADYHYWHGRIFDAIDSIYEATREYETALRLNSRHARAYRALGMAAMSKNRLTQAREYFDKYRQVAPEDDSIWLDIAQTWVRQNKDAEALEIYEKIVRQNPDSAQAMIEIASIAARKGDDNRAIDLYRRATKAQPDLGDSWCQLGLALGVDWDKKAAKLSKETESALKKCVESNAASELKGSAKKVLQAHGLGS